MREFPSLRFVGAAMNTLANLSEYVGCYKFITHHSFKDVFNCYITNNNYEVASSALCVISKLLDRVASKGYPLNKTA
jgi:hypothetical protein